MIDQYEISIIPINLYAGGKLYRDLIDLTPSQAYELFLKEPETFRTSAPSPEDCLNVYREVSRRAQNILCVTVSVKISTVYNVALDARELALAEQPSVATEVLDSNTATTAEGFVALAAARAAAAGKTFPEVISEAQKVRDRVNCIVFLDTIRHVYRSGRIPRVASQVGSILNIRPIFTVHETVHFATAVRSRQHGIERILQMTRERVGQRPVHMAVMHAYALEEAQKLKERVATEFNCAELLLTEFSPVMGYACGTGTIGLAFYPEE